jgi:hypothetical protein
LAAALPELALLTACEKQVATNQEVTSTDLSAASQSAANRTIWTKTIHLSGANEVPPNTSGTTGVCILRATGDLTLHSKINVEDLPAGDALRFAHIHNGVAGTNGGVWKFLCHTTADFGINITQQLTQAEFNKLMTDPLL